MGKLSILGAQRVKALQEMLKQNENETIASLDVPSYDEVCKMVDAEFGIDGIQDEIDKLIGKANELAQKISDVSGTQVKISKNLRYGYSDTETSYKKRVRELQQELRDDKIVQVKEHFKNKSQMLWLCETLEEAKAIVGIE
jgi:hypothetical protein